MIIMIHIRQKMNKESNTLVDMKFKLKMKVNSKLQEELLDQKVQI